MVDDRSADSNSGSAVGLVVYVCRRPGSGGAGARAAADMLGRRGGRGDGCEAGHTVRPVVARRRRCRRPEPSDEAGRSTAAPLPVTGQPAARPRFRRPAGVPAPAAPRHSCGLANGPAGRAAREPTTVAAFRCRPSTPTTARALPARRASTAPRQRVLVTQARGQPGHPARLRRESTSTSPDGAAPNPRAAS